ncbi:SDR family NAD(P)-dependent oxidoreductase [Pleomorphovibrio marinus]|uniref:SDR family NAD(P)-dependent oxidoreductase n=1 Tax=Pleomorphovibrio marinus TaxID=2164132 RepID=UPI000E0BD39A|nr:SDR family oxidoreductase [Pleomorphovibrio marinus]
MDSYLFNPSTSTPVAVVTGAGVGIGLSICKELARNGVKVVLNDVEVNLCQLAVEEVNRLVPGSCLAWPGDASDPDFLASMVKEAVSHFGGLTIAIPNAGITLFGPFLDYAREDLKKVIDLNIQGSFFLAQAAARQMVKQGKGGSILFMSSVTGHQAHKDLAAYGMSKAALEMLAKTLVLELSPHKITVNAIAPGATLTERTSAEEGYEKTWADITPIGKPALPEDIANAAVFLVSDRARHITGQSLVIDGGWTSTSPSPYR